jgi:hypothetical protein
VGRISAWDCRHLSRPRPPVPETSGSAPPGPAEHDGQHRLGPLKVAGSGFPAPGSDPTLNAQPHAALTLTCAQHWRPWPPQRRQAASACRSACVRVGCGPLQAGKGRHWGHVCMALAVAVRHQAPAPQAARAGQPFGTQILQANSGGWRRPTWLTILMVRAGQGSVFVQGQGAGHRLRGTPLLAILLENALGYCIQHVGKCVVLVTRGGRPHGASSHWLAHNRPPLPPGLAPASYTAAQATALRLCCAGGKHRRATSRSWLLSSETSLCPGCL